MCGVAGDEHPPGAVVPGLLALREEPRTPPHLGHAEVFAGDALERGTHLLHGDRLLQRSLFPQAVPRDGAEPAVAERYDDHRAALVGDAGQRVGRRRRQPHIGKQNVRLVLLADEVDAEQSPDGAVRAVAAHHVSGTDGLAAGHFDGHPIAVLRQPDHLGTADDRHAELGGPRLEHLLGSALRNHEQHRIPRRQSAQIHHRPAGRGDLVHRHTAAEQVVGHPPRVEQLECAGVHGECPGDVGLVRARFEQPDAHPAERELARQHQAGRARTHDHYICCVHDAG